PKVAHILDIDSNVLISYQNPSNITGGTKDCDGYMKTITTFNGAYTFSSALCNRPDSSNILMTPTTLGSIMSFSWKPTIIYAAPSNSVVKYTSEISYTNPNGVVDVKYPSYARSTSSSTLADGTTVTVTNGVVNQSVKILGMSNSRNTFDILSGNDTNKVGSLTRTDIKNLIHKNVELMTKGGVPASARYEVHTGDYTIPEIWPVGKDTIIIKGGDVTIDNNISNGSTMKSIIALKDSMGTGGKIKISKNVSNIAAVLYADKSIISGSSSIPYYSDTPPNIQTATGQLFIEGSIISDNTIGGASMTPLKCPYGAGTCTDQEAKRYDLNYFRFYTGTGATSPGAAIGVPSEGIGYPFVIKYDSRLQTAPPPGFKVTE
ncbi:MAG: hypothetical protein Q8K26_01450, partial [Candidatus Gracilibacteria bacterium]|nr:hypothetical protein [Candidatus Gracilibacteria bacterium]